MSLHMTKLLYLLKYGGGGPKYLFIASSKGMTPTISSDIPAVLGGQNQQGREANAMICFSVC